jgi:hypothetical protein
MSQNKNRRDDEYRDEIVPSDQKERTISPHTKIKETGHKMVGDKTSLEPLK